ncbi:hypothetical protein ABT392_04195 [Paucibacter sp. JuS9]|uniref:hypothetical protein n=1 Tax=Paucibacter sp. JuS9 TaxID=3228748 RepID=UPI003757C255
MGQPAGYVSRQQQHDVMSLPQSLHPARRNQRFDGGGAVVEQEMKLPLPDAKKVKELLTTVEQHPLGMLLLTILVGVAGYFWRK